MFYYNQARARAETTSNLSQGPQSLCSIDVMQRQNAGGAVKRTDRCFIDCYFQQFNPIGK